jgi:ABC-type transporter Mla MlaB component
VSARETNGERALLIELADRQQAERLVRFLEQRACAAHRERESCVVINDFERDSAGLATLIALVEEWRAAEHVPETTLELGGRKTILRTEA